MIGLILIYVTDVGGNIGTKMVENVPPYEADRREPESRTAKGCKARS